MEEHLNPLAVTHLLQHTLRSFCIPENSLWVYAVFWRILPRNYPPPKWDGQPYDRSGGNRRNWILVWEDGFCNFSASSADGNSGADCPGSSIRGNCEFQQLRGLQPELFFKMSHEIYYYGEGLIGKVAADHSHKYVYKEANDQEINFLSAWHCNSPDLHPRTWEAQFQSGIETIALIAVKEGVVQLGSLHKVAEDLNHLVLLRKKFSYIGSIPGVLLPHPLSSSAVAASASSAVPCYNQFDSSIYSATPFDWHSRGALLPSPTNQQFCYDHFTQQPMKITPSMSSLEALLSKLPSVMPPTPGFCESSLPQFQVGTDVASTNKKAVNDGEEEYGVHENEMGESSSSVPYHMQFHNP